MRLDLEFFTQTLYNGQITNIGKRHRSFLCKYKQPMHTRFEMIVFSLCDFSFSTTSTSNPRPVMLGSFGRTATKKFHPAAIISREATEIETQLAAFRHLGVWISGGGGKGN
jgi:hypothetical protein